MRAVEQVAAGPRAARSSLAAPFPVFFSLPDATDIDSLVAWTPPCAVLRARARIQGAPNHPRSDAHARATSPQLARALRRSILRSRPHRSPVAPITWEPESGHLRAPQVPTMAEIDLSMATVTHSLFFESLKVCRRRSNPSHTRTLGRAGAHYWLPRCRSPVGRARCGRAGAHPRLPPEA